MAVPTRQVGVNEIAPHLITDLYGRPWFKWSPGLVSNIRRYLDKVFETPTTTMGSEACQVLNLAFSSTELHLCGEEQRTSCPICVDKAIELLLRGSFVRRWTNVDTPADAARFLVETSRGDLVLSQQRVTDLLGRVVGGENLLHRFGYQRILAETRALVTSQGLDPDRYFGHEILDEFLERGLAYDVDGTGRTRSAIDDANQVLCNADKVMWHLVLPAIAEAMDDNERLQAETFVAAHSDGATAQFPVLYMPAPATLVEALRAYQQKHAYVLPEHMTALLWVLDPPVHYTLPSRGFAGNELRIRVFSELAETAKLPYRVDGLTVDEAERNVELLTERFGIELYANDLASYPRLRSLCAGAALRRRPRTGTGTSQVQPDGPVSTSADVFWLLRSQVETHGGLLPKTLMGAATVKAVEAVTGMTWEEVLSEAYQLHGWTRAGITGPELRLQELARDLFEGQPASVVQFWRDPETLGRQEVDLYVAVGGVEWCFEADGPHHFGSVLNWDTDGARTRDADKARSVSQARKTGRNIRLFSIHHQLLQRRGLTVENLAGLISDQTVANAQWVFLRPAGTEDMREVDGTPVLHAVVDGVECWIIP